MLASGNGTQNTIAKGSDANSTLKNYRSLFTTKTASSSNKSTFKNVTGTVERTSLSQNFVSFLLKGDSIIYKVNIDEYPLGQFVQPGDQVSFKVELFTDTGYVDSKINNQQLQN